MSVATRPRAAELLERMGPELYRTAYKRGLSLSAWLEREDPSDGYKDGLTAFERLLKVAGIVVRSDPAAGYWADYFEAFDRTPQTRALVPEWAASIWRAMRPKVIREPATGARILLTGDAEALGSVMRPYVDAAAARLQQITPAIPLSEIVAFDTAIDSDAYRAFYLTEPTAAEKRLVRVGQGAEIPRTLLKGTDHTIRLYKYGRVLEATYEVLRRQRIDKVAIWIARVAIQAEVDEVGAAIDVLVNGDGNAGTAATVHTLTSLDSGAVAGTLTLKGWLAFKLKFANPYAITSSLVQEAGALQLVLLTTGNANVPLVTIQAASGFGGFTPINPELRDNVRLGITVDAPTLQVVGFDRRLALERVTEIGSDIQEVERYATRQTQALVLSEVVGYAVFDQLATRILNINA